MRKIPTRVHGILDYLTGALLIAAPWLLNFNRGGAETWVPVLLGVATIIYSLVTNYEFGIAPLISTRTHLMLDLLSGILLAASPWLFGFNELVYLPHLIVGLFEIIVSLSTEKSPVRSHGRQHAH